MARQLNKTSTPVTIRVDTAPRFAALWAIGIYVLCALVLAWPALTGQFLVNPNSDQYIAGYAFRHFGAQALATTGGFPLWNPYIFGGIPYVGAMHGDIFYPTFLLRMVLPTDVAMTWSFIIHLILAGCFSYGFLRAWGFSFGASLIGGLAYMLGGNVAGQVSPGHDGKMYVSAMFPLICWLLVRGIRDGRAGAWGLLSIVIGLSVLSPHPQLLQYSLVGAGAFALLLAFGLQERSPPRDIAIRRLGLAVGAIVLGFAIGAIQYLPVMEYVSWSPRAAGVGGWQVATSYSLPPEEILNFYLPYFSGLLEHYWGRNYIHLHSEYIGAAVIMLAALAFGGAAELGRVRWRRFWLGAFVVSLLWALGGFTPFYRIVYAVVPGTKFFRAPSTMLFMVSFTVAMLAAEGVERVRLATVGTRRLIVLAGLAGFMTLLAISGALGNLGESLADPQRYEALADPTGVRIDGVRTLVFALATLAVAYAVLQRRLTSRMAVPVLAALVVVDLWSVERHYFQFIAPASESFGRDPIIDYLSKDSIPGRVLAMPVTNDFAPHEPVLLGDGLMAHGIRAVLGYHGNELGRFTDLGGRETGYQNVATPAFARLYNVRYVLANGDIPQLTKVLGPVKTAAGTNVTLYRFPGDNPAAWLATTIVKAPDEAVRATVLDGRFDPRTVALVDSSARVTGQNITLMPPAATIPARVTRFDPGAIDVTLDASAPAGSALVVSENFYPGWRAKVDGKPVVTARTDYTLIGVPLTEGARKVELRFTSAPYETGKTITLIALLLGAILSIAGLVVERRQGRVAVVT
jgi:hypothetical protein